jgi:hypothetical protein
MLYLVQYSACERTSDVQSLEGRSKIYSNVCPVKNAAIPSDALARVSHTLFPEDVKSHRY